MVGRSIAVNVTASGMNVVVTGDSDGTVMAEYRWRWRTRGSLLAVSRCSLYCTGVGCRFCRFTARCTT